MVNRVHVLVIKDLETGRRMVFNSQRGDVEQGVRILQEAESICGHNIICYDIPALKKVYPWFNPKGKARDTLSISHLIFTTLKDIDFGKARKGPYIPKHLYGRHSLEAWGQRLGNYKGDFKGPWEKWTQEMEDYCVQDVEVNESLYAYFMSLDYSEEAIDLECKVREIVFRQETHGFGFDKEAASRLLVELTKRKLELEEELKRVFVPWYKPSVVFTPKRSNRGMGYVEGCPLTKIVLTEFNPGSRDHIADRLIKLRGWKPTEYGENGRPTVDEDVLKSLPYPEAPLLVEYLTVDKRLGQLSGGKQAWLKVERNGRVHGRVNTNGAVTGRMTHDKPNVAQVPRVGTKYGAECRALFVASSGKILVGADAEGLEARCLGHFMAKWDGGAYGKTVVEGRKEDRTDVHSVNQDALGIDSRDDAKTWFYAFIYGAGDAKLGSILGKGPSEGKKSKRKFFKKIPALKSLVDAVQKAAARGWLKGLDGRRLHVRSSHAALNTLLQGAGAVIMKKALVILDADLQSLGFAPGRDYEFCANVHDEWQIEVFNPENAETVGQTAKRAIEKAGDHFGFRCPLTGDFKVGRNWAETH